ncbi:hypothetical protein ABE426_13620 [Sphingobacterium faecium]|uniref:hypothetical protein n=1 Tax=Sphingobacterium faecium TaxID=34087 RepID=UPI0032088DDF
MEDKDYPIYILDNEHIDISSRIGDVVNGILGSRFFADYRIAFDFLTKNNSTSKEQHSKIMVKVNSITH